MYKRTTMALIALALTMLSVELPAQAQLQRTFTLKPNPATLNCLRQGAATPTATVIVGQGALTDDLTIIGSGIKPGLAFDMFTVQNSSLLANGSPDPHFTNFGLAWYQSDLEANSSG